MLPFELLYDRFGPFWTALIAFLIFRGFLRLKRFLRAPTLLLVLVLACVPGVTSHLYLFAILEISVLGGNLFGALARPRNNGTK